jgi:DNA-binding LytR/AlgR family response regulator
VRILMLEDEPVIAGRIERICREYFEGRSLTIHMFRDLMSAREFLAVQAVDLLLLDLNLNGRDGFSLLEAGSNRALYTIIVSAHAEQAIKAFEYGVLDFVGKPFTQQRLQSALARVDNVKWRSDSALERLAVRGAHGLHLIALSAINHIRAAGHYCEFVMDDGRVWLHDKNIDLLAGLLPGNFERIHRSYIVPLQKVETLLVEPGGKYGVRLHDGTALPVGRSRYPALKSRCALG